MANELIDVGAIGALETQLVSSRIQVTNNALYQTIKGIIANLKSTAKQINSNTNAIFTINHPIPTPPLTFVQMVTGATPAQPMFIGGNALLIGFRP